MNTEHSNNDSYKLLGLSLAFSFCLMYAIMFLNVESFSHVYLNITRLYMTLLMVTTMALLMLAIMHRMFKNRKMNIIIGVTSALVFIGAFAGLREQTLISDVQYMKAMIPHHSSAIMVSKNADLRDPEVQKLAKQIIESQVREIAEMKEALERLEK